MKKLQHIPKFKDVAEEAEFWATHDTTDYIDWSKAMVNPSFSNLKLSTKTITIRVTESLLASLKMLAHKKDVPYQSLAKVFLDEKIREESMAV